MLLPPATFRVMLWHDSQMSSVALEVVLSEVGGLVVKFPYLEKAPDPVHAVVRPLPDRPLVVRPGTLRTKCVPLPRIGTAVWQETHMEDTLLFGTPLYP